MNSTYPNEDSKKRKLNGDFKSSFISRSNLLLVLDELHAMMIPGIIWKYLFTFLDVNSLLNMYAVCKTFHNILSQPNGQIFWKNAVKRFYPDLFEAIESLEKIMDNPYRRFLLADVNKRGDIYHNNLNLDELISYTKKKSFYYITYCDYQVWVLKREDEEKQNTTQKRRRYKLREDKRGKMSLEEYAQKCKENSNSIHKNISVNLPDKFVMVGKITEHSKDKLKGHPDRDWVVECFAGELSYMFMNGFSFIRSFSSTFIGDSKLGRLDGQGKITFSDQKFYKGSFENESFSGKGIFGNAVGFFESDYWVDGNIKKGVFHWKEGGYYLGEFDENKCFHGKGIFVSDYGATKSSSNWNKGNVIGDFEYTDPSGHKMNLYADSADCDSYPNFFEALNEDIKKCYELNICTRAYTQKSFFPQLYFHCVDCNLVENEGICFSCANVCHKGHKLTPTTAPLNSLSFYCDCPSKTYCNSYLFNNDYRSHFKNNFTTKKVYYDPKTSCELSSESK